MNSVERHPLEAYADSYAMFARNDWPCDGRSVEVDIRQNMIPATVSRSDYDRLRAENERLVKALEPFAAFAEALNDAIPEDIAIGIYADGAMRFGPSGGANVGHLRAALTARLQSGRGKHG